jgi:hypothetical protein
MGNRRLELLSTEELTTRQPSRCFSLWDTIGLVLGGPNGKHTSEIRVKGFFVRFGWAFCLCSHLNPPTSFTSAKLSTIGLLIALNRPSYSPCSLASTAWPTGWIDMHVSAYFSVRPILASKSSKICSRSRIQNYCQFLEYGLGLPTRVRCACPVNLTDRVNLRYRASPETPISFG